MISFLTAAAVSTSVATAVELFTGGFVIGLTSIFRIKNDDK